jgi:hypothetical protein
MRQDTAVPAAARPRLLPAARWRQHSYFCTSKAKRAGVSIHTFVLVKKNAPAKLASQLSKLSKLSTTEQSGRKLLVYKVPGETKGVK